MSEADTSRGVPPIARSTSAETPGHEAYSFACMRCGHGWEQEYEIRHRMDAEGRAVVTYYVEGRRVPSPLSRPACVNCGGRVLRIMRSGQIPTAAAALEEQGIAGPFLGSAPMKPPVTERPAEDEGHAPEGGEEPVRRHRFPHLFHRK
jgi:hypothetical protein